MKRLLIGRLRKYLTILRIMQEYKENNTKTIHRLQEYITEAGVSFNKLSLDLGVSNSYFSKMIKNNGSIGSDILENILRMFPDLNADWLLTGKGSKNRNNSLDNIALSDTYKENTDLSTEKTLLYQMYQQEKAEKEAKIEEIGALKERIRQLESDEERSLNLNNAKNVSTKKSSSQKIDDACSATAQ